MKFAPVTVIVAGVVVPAAIEVGLSDAIVGPVTLNVLAGEEAAQQKL